MKDSRELKINIGVTAHDTKKNELVKYLGEVESYLKECNIYATGNTAFIIEDKTGIRVKRLLPGEAGGYEQLSSLVAEGKIDMIIFLRDPFYNSVASNAEEALHRICDINNVIFASNIKMARIITSFALVKGDIPDTIVWEDL